MNIVKFNEFIIESSGDKFPNIKSYDISGFIVNVGRDAKSNDHLTFNLSGPNDIWMHVKGSPGSHVVIKVLSGKIPTERVLKEVALLAKNFSKAKKENNVTVVYCKKKFVKKESGMNDGQVIVDYKNAYDINI